jgi:hypothetical protein
LPQPSATGPQFFASDSHVSGTQSASAPEPVSPSVLPVAPSEFPVVLPLPPEPLEAPSPVESSPSLWEPEFEAPEPVVEEFEAPFLAPDPVPLPEVEPDASSPPELPHADNANTNTEAAVARILNIVLSLAPAPPPRVEQSDRTAARTSGHIARCGSNRDSGHGLCSS